MAAPALALAALLLLQGCAERPAEPLLVKPEIPRSLLRPLPAPPPPVLGDDFRDLALYALGLGGALEACNARLGRIDALLEAFGRAPP